MGAAFLSAINYGELLWPFNPKASSVNFPFLFGLIFCGAPLLVILYWLKYGERDKEGKLDWSILLSDSIEDYKQDITEDGERSSIEFEKYFKNILGYSIGKDKTFKRAIIVVDNLDRVDSGHANQLWSTLQTFFQHRSNKKSKEKSWMECLWFIVPYDREGLSRIWMTRSNDAEQEQNDSTAQSFLNKCFQIRAEVPAPVMSAWNEYTIQSANKALTGWPEGEKNKVIRTYKRHASRLDMSPTPREINNFVNQVGFIGMRWGGIMSAESISLYSILRKKYSEGSLRIALLNEAELPDQFEALGNTKTIKQELAGLLFGVTKEKGVELLLTPEIKKSITSGDGEILKKLIENHREAFWITWDVIKGMVMPTDSHTEEYRIAATKAISIGMSENLNRIRTELNGLEQIWRNSTDKWKLNNFDYSEPLDIVCNFTENKSDFLDWIQKILTAKLRTLVTKVGKPEFDIDELKQFDRLANFLKNNNKPFTQLHYEYLDINNWPIWISLLKENEVSLPNVFASKGVIETIGNQYLPSSTTLHEDNLTLLLDTYYIYPKSTEWVSVITNLITWANRSNRELGNDLAYKLMLNLYRFNNTTSKKLIQSCIEEAPFWVRGNAETIDDTPTLPLLFGCVLGSNLQENPSVNSTLTSYWSTEENSIEKINFAYDILSEAGQLSLLWEIAKDNRNLFAIELLETKIDSIELYSQKEAVFNLENYSKWFDKTKHSKIINHLCKYGAFDKATDIIKNSPENYPYTLYLLQQYGTSVATNFVNSILPLISTEIWNKAFKKSNYLLACALDDGVKLDHKYKEAFEEFFSESMKGQDTTDWQWVNFEGLLNKTIDKDILLKKLTSEYMSTEQDMLNAKAFNAISKHISNHIKKVSSTKLMERLCYWFDKKEWNRIEWLINLKIKTRVKPLEGLSSRVNDALKDEENNDRISTITELAKVFSVVIIKKSESEDSKKD